MNLTPASHLIKCTLDLDQPSAVSRLRSIPAISLSVRPAWWTDSPGSDSGFWYHFRKWYHWYHVWYHRYETNLFQAAAPFFNDLHVNKSIGNGTIAGLGISFLHLPDRNAIQQHTGGSDLQTVIIKCHLNVSRLQIRPVLCEVNSYAKSVLILPKTGAFFFL